MGKYDIAIFLRGKYIILKFWREYMKFSLYIKQEKIKPFHNKHVPEAYPFYLTNLQSNQYITKSNRTQVIVWSNQSKIKNELKKRRQEWSSLGKLFVLFISSPSHIWESLMSDMIRLNYVGICTSGLYLRNSLQFQFFIQISTPISNDSKNWI